MVTVSIDDQIENGEEIVRLMKKINPGGEHYAFSSAEKAYDLIEEKLPDVCWLDVEMPGSSGLEVSVDIKLMSPKTNIIFVTAHEKFAYPSYKLHPSGFILKPVTEKDLREELNHLKFPVEHKREDAILRVQCFGEFEVFDQKGNPVKFTRTKSKELFAYMIDRRGDVCTTREFSEVLFGNMEDEEQKKKQMNHVRVALKDLRRDLKKAGASEVLINAWNSYGIDCQKIDCDYFDFLREESYAVNRFQGEYMAQYSWAEMTLGELYSHTGWY
ncbi:MAG: response regulator [Lachnospiraceae bacterium]|nr:response regulator [Lachnospiraceae bacterium]